MTRIRILLVTQTLFTLAVAASCLTEKDHRPYVPTSSGQFLQKFSSASVDWKSSETLQITLNDVSPEVAFQTAGNFVILRTSELVHCVQHSSPRSVRAELLVSDDNGRLQRFLFDLVSATYVPEQSSLTYVGRPTPLLPDQLVWELESVATPEDLPGRLSQGALWLSAPSEAAYPNPEPYSLLPMAPDKQPLARRMGARAPHSL